MDRTSRIPVTDSGHTAVAIQHCKRSEESGRQRTGSSKGIYKPASMKLSMEPWSTCSARRLKMSAFSTSSGNSCVQDTWIFVEPRGTALREHPKAASPLPLQSCKLFFRDRYHSDMGRSETRH